MAKPVRTPRGVSLIRTAAAVRGLTRHARDSAVEAWAEETAKRLERNLLRGSNWREGVEKALLALAAQLRTQRAALLAFRAAGAKVPVMSDGFQRMRRSLGEASGADPARVYAAMAAVTGIMAAWVLDERAARKSGLTSQRVGRLAARAASALLEPAS